MENFTIKGSFIHHTHAHTIYFPIIMQTLVTMKSCLSLVFSKFCFAINCLTRLRLY